MTVAATPPVGVVSVQTAWRRPRRDGAGDRGAAAGPGDADIDGVGGVDGRGIRQVGGDRGRRADDGRGGHDERGVAGHRVKVLPPHGPAAGSSGSRSSERDGAAGVATVVAIDDGEVAVRRRRRRRRSSWSTLPPGRPPTAGDRDAARIGGGAVRDGDGVGRRVPGRRPGSAPARPTETEVIAAMAVIGTMSETRIRSPWTIARARIVRRVYGLTVGTRFIRFPRVRMVVVHRGRWSMGWGRSGTRSAGTHRVGVESGGQRTGEPTGPRSHRRGPLGAGA